MALEYENIRQAQPNTRQQRRQAKVAERAERNQEKSKEKESRRPKFRLIPIWLRLLIVTLLLVVSMTIGLMVGYGVIGDGKASDILKISTWNHLVDLIEKGVPEKDGK